MTEKLRCPKCSAQLTRKAQKHYYHDTGINTLICKPCERLHPYKGFRARYDYTGELDTVETYFNIENYKFHLSLHKETKTSYYPYQSHVSYVVSLYLEDKSGNSWGRATPIKSFDGYELIDQDVDILDFYSLFSFFKKECRRWHKLKAFL